MNFIADYCCVINCEAQNELKELKAKLKDAGWDCVDDVINAEKEYEEKCNKLEKDDELKIALKTACNAIYGVHSFEHITNIEKKCKKLEEELNHYHELDGLVAKLGFHDMDEAIKEIKCCLNIKKALVEILHIPYMPYMPFKPENVSWFDICDEIHKMGNELEEIIERYKRLHNDYDELKKCFRIINCLVDEQNTVIEVSTRIDRNGISKSDIKTDTIKIGTPLHVKMRLLLKTNYSKHASNIISIEKSRMEQKH